MKPFFLIGLPFLTIPMHHNVADTVIRTSVLISTVSSKPCDGAWKNTVCLSFEFADTGRKVEVLPGGKVVGSQKDKDDVLRFLAKYAEDRQIEDERQRKEVEKEMEEMENSQDDNGIRRLVL